MKKDRPAGLRFITRYDYQGRHGWWVRIQRRLEKKSAPLVISQFFADDKYGGDGPGLIAAQRFRDAAAITAPAPRAEKHQPAGVRRGYGYVRTEGAVVRGWYRDSRGKVHRKTMSIAKWTREEAEKRVRQWLARKTGSPSLEAVWP